MVVESSPEQPFFIRGRGWSSSAPKLTEKLLQLPCTTLTVGDICITLTRQNLRVQPGTTSSGGPATHHPSSSGRGSKAKSGVTRPYGTYAKSRNASTSSILKSSHPQQRANNAGGGARANARKSVSGPTATVSGTTNIDVNSSGNTISNFGINNPPNPIIRQPQKISSPEMPPASKQVEQQEKSVVVGKEVDLSVPKTSNTTDTTSATPVTKNVSVGENNGLSFLKSVPLPVATSSTAQAARYKRKSISPVPLGSDRSKDNADDREDTMRPPSPKKRRWSAPEQMEVDSQLSNASCRSSDKLQASDAKCLQMKVQTREETESSSVSSISKPKMNESKDSNKTTEGISSMNEMTSSDIPPEKA